MDQSFIIDVPALVSDLRSGKYTQGPEVLHHETNNTYCCLGVVCDRLTTEGKLQTASVEAPGSVLPGNVTGYGLGENREENYPYRKSGWTSVLPDFVVFPEGMGIRESSTGVLPYQPFMVGMSLAELNDSGQFTFAMIADILEYLYINNVRKSENV